MRKLIAICLFLVAILLVPCSACAGDRMSYSPTVTDKVTIANEYTASKWFDLEDTRAKLSVFLYLDLVEKYKDFDIDVNYTHIGYGDGILSAGYWSESSDAVIVLYEIAKEKYYSYDEGKATGMWLPEFTQSSQMEELFDMSFTQYYPVSVDAQLKAISWVKWQLGKTGVNGNYEKALNELEAKLTNASSVETTPQTNPNELGIWCIQQYKDEFKQPIGKEFITTSQLLTGTFSNSAVTDAYLSALLIIDEDGISIILVEYGKNYVVGYSSKKINYDVKLRDTYGNTETLYATLNPNESQLRFSDGSVQDILEALNQNGTISFYVERSDREIENYLFTINDTSYFSNAWNKLIGK